MRRPIPSIAAARGRSFPTCSRVATISARTAFDGPAGAMPSRHRQSVAVARLPAGAEPDPAGEATIPTEHEVEVALADGSRLRGFVSYVLPPERARLVDFLNQKERFFRLTGREGVALVARAHVASVTLLPG